MTKQKKPKTYRKLHQFHLPVEYHTMDGYIKSHKTEIQEHILKCIDFANRRQLDKVDILNFDGSSYVITLHKESYIDNAKYIFDDFMASERYENCEFAKKILYKLNYDKKDT